jgi:hypothetical protein
MIVNTYTIQGVSYLLLRVARSDSIVIEIKDGWRTVLASYRSPQPNCFLSECLGKSKTKSQHATPVYRGGCGVFNYINLKRSSC